MACSNHKILLTVSYQFYLILFIIIITLFKHLALNFSLSVLGHKPAFLFVCDMTEMI